MVARFSCVSWTSGWVLATSSRGIAAIASGIDPRTSADRLGHSSASFMLKTYAHAVAGAQEHAAAVANGLLTRSGRT
jgi:hypothetical protein